MGRIGVASAWIVLLALGAVRATAQRQDAKVVEAQKLRDNLYLLSGGGNSLAFITDLGVTLVDTKGSGWDRPLLEKLKSITPKPVTTIINTHAHAESFGGNELLPTSVEIVAQENTRLNMDRLDAFKGAKVNFLPKLMFRDKMTLGAGKDRVDLYYFGAGHTSGDAWVVFPALRIAHAGDMVLPRQVPIFDFENGGSGLAYSATLAKAAARLKDVDTIVPGQGPLLKVRDLDEYARLAADLRDVAVSGFHHGLGISEVAEAWKLPEAFRGYTPPGDRIKSDVQAIFSELTSATSR